MGSASSSELRGAVIDSSLLNSTSMAQRGVNTASMTRDIGMDEAGFDLNSQIQQWLVFEKTQYGKDRSREVVKQRTVFFIWFSNWELWYYSRGDFPNAHMAVRKSLDALFEQLDLVAENWTSKPKVVLLGAIDVTFLPSWRKFRTGPYGVDPLAESQQSAVLLVEQWNRALDERASRWKRGQVYVYNTNDWFLKQLRIHHVNKAKPVNASDLESDSALWGKIREGCLGSNDPSLEMTHNNENAVKCSDPDSYLFW